MKIILIFRNILMFFLELVESTPDKKILVHCYSGVSRSAIVVMSYLIKLKSIELNEKQFKKYSISKCLKLIRKYRPHVSPNDGFMSQLNNYFDNLANKNK